MATDPVLRGTVLAALFDEMREALTEIQNSRQVFAELKAFLDEHPDVDEKFGTWQRSKRKAAEKAARRTRRR